MPGLPYPAFRMVYAEPGGGPSVDGSPYTLRNSIIGRMPTSRRGRDRFRSALRLPDYQFPSAEIRHRFQTMLK